MTDKELIEILNNAIDKFYHLDSLLIQRRGMEQACVFKIGTYVEEQLQVNINLKNLKVDCEYNKNRNQPKITPRFKNGIRPDLIIHKRGDNSQNLLAIEFKGWWSKKGERDIHKLEDLTNRYGEYSYQLGIFVRLTKYKNDLIVKYYKNGEEIAL